MSDKTRILLSDTNILDALLKADLTAILDVLVKALDVELCMIDRVFDELAEEWGEATAALPAVAVLRTFDDLSLEAEINEMCARRRALSETDAAQLCLAKARGMTLWTNDGPLYDAAREDGLEAMRLFKPVIEAVASGALPSSLAYRLLDNERTNNLWFSDVAATAVETALKEAVGRLWRPGERRTENGERNARQARDG